MTRASLVRWFLVCAALAAFPVSSEARAIEAAPIERLVLAHPLTKAGDPVGVGRLALDSAVYQRLRARGSAVIESFPLPGRQAVDLELTSFTPLAAHARFVVVDGAGTRDVPAPDVRFFRGRVRGDLDSLVTLGMFEGRVAGFVRAFGEEFAFGPESYNLAREGAADLRIWNRELADQAPETPTCAGHFDPQVDELALAAPDVGAAALSIDAGTALRATVAVDATYEWYNRFGSVAAAQNYILNLMAQVSTIYESEVNVEIAIPYVRIFSVPTDPYTGTADTLTLLNELRAAWNAGQTGVSRSLVHLFHYRSNGGSGIAYLDVLCGNQQSPGNSYDYGLSSIPGAGSAWEKDMVAHELGHNFASPHTHCYLPEIDKCANQSGCYTGPIVPSVGTIMSYCSQKTSVFGQRVRDVIRPAAEAAYPQCLTTGGSPGQIAASEPAASLRLRKPAQCPTATLQNDDGGLNTTYGMTSTWQLAWIKRLTPGCLPYRLDRVDVLIPASAGVAVGRPLRLLVYVDPTGSGSPANATLVHTQDVTVLTTSSGTYNQYTLSAPVMLTAGHVYVGFYDLLRDSATNYLAAVDTGHSGDSFRATDSTSPEAFASHTGGSWMLRAGGGAVGSAGALLEWGPPCNAAAVPDQDFAVYRGTLGSFSSASSLACSTARAASFVATATGNSFFLVVPQTSAAEGSYGQTSTGAERPPAAQACKPQSVGACE